jgi:hypothetical protein
MRKDSLIPSLLGIPPIQISRELLLVLETAFSDRTMALLCSGFSVAVT